MDTAIEKKIKKDTKICKLLKTKELRYHIGMTDKHQSIDLIFTTEDSKYNFLLDATPLETEDNEAMLKIYNLF